MDGLIQFGIDFIVRFQAMGDWLTAPMKFFTFLGSENFFLFFLPVIYWCVNAALGLRVGFILLTGTWLNDVLKMALHAPRPFWVSTEVRGLTLGKDVTGFGIPSGHAQTGAGLWGIAAAYFRKTWAWVVALLVIFFIGLSRLYLGVHFPHDVLVGWVLGFLTLWAFVKFWDPVSERVKAMPFRNQVLLAFAVSLGMILPSALIVFLSQDFVMPADWIANAMRDGGLMPAPFSLDGTITAAATLFGLCVGLAWKAPRGGFSAEGSVSKRVLRYVVGVIGIALFYGGLKAIFPSDPGLVSYVFRYIRYTLIGAWVSAGAPWVFSKLQIG